MSTNLYHNFVLYSTGTERDREYNAGKVLVLRTGVLSSTEYCICTEYDTVVLTLGIQYILKIRTAVAGTTQSTYCIQRMHAEHCILSIYCTL